MAETLEDAFAGVVGVAQDEGPDPIVPIAYSEECEYVLKAHLLNSTGERKSERTPNVFLYRQTVHGSIQSMHPCRRKVTEGP